ncbi:uncharacterized protein LOC144169078 [Haemaphysalis longicornis]
MGKALLAMNLHRAFNSIFLAAPRSAGPIVLGPVWFGCCAWPSTSQDLRHQGQEEAPRGAPLAEGQQAQLFTVLRCQLGAVWEAPAKGLLHNGLVLAEGLLATRPAAAQAKVSLHFIQHSATRAGYSIQCLVNLDYFWGINVKHSG